MNAAAVRASLFDSPVAALCLKPVCNDRLLFLDHHEKPFRAVSDARPFEIDARSSMLPIVKCRAECIRINLLLPPMLKSALLCNGQRAPMRPIKHLKIL
jgi:hypothetical protein